MRKSFVILSTLALAFGAAGTADAQSGFALKGSLLFNSSSVEAEGQNLDYEDSNGFNVGAEYVLPFGIGIGISGYTAGSPDDFNFSEGSLITLGEVNYFVNVPALPISPYIGVHTGLGTVEISEIEDTPTPEVDFGDIGFQVGLRFQPHSMFGVDAQYRRISGSLRQAQSADFESNQFLIGVTLF